MKTLRERLAEKFSIVESSESISDPGYDIVFLDYVSFGFPAKDDAERGRDLMLDGLEKVVHDYLQIVFDNPPMREALVDKVEKNVSSRDLDGKQSKESVDDLRMVIKMIRWQQAVIHRLAQDNGYQEGYDKGRRDEVAASESAAGFLDTLGKVADKFRMF